MFIDCSKPSLGASFVFLPLAGRLFSSFLPSFLPFHPGERFRPHRSALPRPLHPVFVHCIFPPAAIEPIRSNVRLFCTPSPDKRNPSPPPLSSSSTVQAKVWRRRERERGVFLLAWDSFDRRGSSIDFFRFLFQFFGVRLIHKIVECVINIFNFNLLSRFRLLLWDFSRVFVIIDRFGIS